MSLSKSSNYLTLLLEIYNGHLRKTPLLTKSITSGVLSFAGALVASYLRGSSHSGLLKNTGPFTIYGLVVAGPVTHYFYNFLEKILANNTIGKILFERLVFCPIFLLFTLYILQRLQGNSHDGAWFDVKRLFLSALKANWKIWTVPQLINLSLIPVEHRVLFANGVAFFWNIYLAGKSSKPLKKD